MSGSDGDEKGEREADMTQQYQLLGGQEAAEDTQYQRLEDEPMDQAVSSASQLDLGIEHALLQEVDGDGGLSMQERLALKQLDVQMSMLMADYEATVNAGRRDVEADPENLGEGWQARQAQCDGILKDLLLSAAPSDTAAAPAPASGGDGNDERKEAKSEQRLSDQRTSDGDEARVHTTAALALVAALSAGDSRAA